MLFRRGFLLREVAAEIDRQVVRINGSVAIEIIGRVGLTPVGEQRVEAGLPRVLRFLLPGADGTLPIAPSARWSSPRRLDKLEVARRGLLGAGPAELAGDNVDLRGLRA